MATAPQALPDDFDPPPQPARPRPRPTAPVQPIAQAIAPAPIAPAVNPIVYAIIGASITAVLSVVVVVCLFAFVVNTDRDPQPEDALVVACRQYRKGQPAVFVSAGEKVRSGELKTKGEVVEYLKQHGKAVADQLNKLVGDACDDKGAITDPDRAGDLLVRTGKALQRR